MAPILGIWASSALPATTATSFESIATVTVGSGGASNVEFTSIPGTYTHLQIRYISKDNRSSVTLNNIIVTVNSDTGSNYTDHFILGDGASAVSGASTPTTAAYLGLSPSGNSSANVFGIGVIDVLDYANTNKYKTFRSLHGIDSNGSGSIRLRSGVWMNTNAITSIKLQPDSSGSFTQYSQFALYGIRS